MNTQKTSLVAPDYLTLSLRLKMAALWASFMVLYTFVDYFALYMPGKLEDILAGKVFTFDISPTFLLVVMGLVALPALMIFLSAALPNYLNRWVTPAIAILLIPYMLFNLTGEAWPHMYLAAGLEVIQLLLIAWYARKLPIEA